MASRVALILGYGARVGTEVAKALAAKGYKIAATSRSGKLYDNAAGYLGIQADLSVSGSVEKVFETVIEKLGHPSVVVYNAAAAHIQRGDILELSLPDLVADTNVNFFSAYVAIQLAVKSFAQTAPDASKTFIYTGNKLHLMAHPSLVANGVGKSAAAHLIHCLVDSYKGQGYKFYFADERNADGTAVYGAIDGPAHGEFYTELAEAKSQGPWNATFVKGRGYVDFQEVKV